MTDHICNADLVAANKPVPRFCALCGIGPCVKQQPQEATTRPPGQPPMIPPDHNSLPVAGYTAQSDDKVKLANRLKEAEERYLRILDEMRIKIGIEQRFVEDAITHMQTANMFAVRAIFQPTRIKLPEDGRHRIPRVLR